MMPDFYAGVYIEYLRIHSKQTTLVCYQLILIKVCQSRPENTLGYIPTRPRCSAPHTTTLYYSVPDLKAGLSIGLNYAHFTSGHCCIYTFMQL